MFPGISTGGGGLSSADSGDATSGTGRVNVGGLTFAPKRQGVGDTLAAVAPWAFVAVAVVAGIRAFKG